MTDITNAAAKALNAELRREREDQMGERTITNPITLILKELKNPALFDVINDLICDSMGYGGASFYSDEKEYFKNEVISGARKLIDAINTQPTEPTDAQIESAAEALYGSSPRSHRFANIDEVYRRHYKQMARRALIAARSA